MTIIANDFVPVKPYTTSVVTLGVSLVIAKRQNICWVGFDYRLVSVPMSLWRQISQPTLPFGCALISASTARRRHSRTRWPSSTIRRRTATRYLPVQLLQSSMTTVATYWFRKRLYEWYWSDDRIILIWLPPSFLSPRLCLQQQHWTLTSLSKRTSQISIYGRWMVRLSERITSMWSHSTSDIVTNQISNALLLLASQGNTSFPNDPVRLSLPPASMVCPTNYATCWEFF